MVDRLALEHARCSSRARRDGAAAGPEDAAGAIAAVDVLREALAGGGPVTRAECTRILEDVGVMKDAKHANHLLWFAAQHGATCIGPQLAVRYFDSHGPALRKELGRWTALPAADVRRAIEPPERDSQVLLLSGFDEYVLGYGDRSTMMTAEQLKLVIPGGNGIFRPTVVDDGVVVGTWNRTIKKARVEVAVSPFGDSNARQRRGIDRAAGGYGDFLDLDADVTFVER